jgi:hypothetical protein
MKLLGKLSATPDSKMEILADVGICLFPNSLVSAFQPRSGEQAKVLVVSLDWTRPKRKDCQASHAFHSRWAFPNVLLKSTSRQKRLGESK